MLNKDSWINHWKFLGFGVYRPKFIKQVIPCMICNLEQVTQINCFGFDIWKKKWKKEDSYFLG